MDVRQHEQARAHKNHNQETEREEQRRRHFHRCDDLCHLVEIGHQNKPHGRSHRWERGQQRTAHKISRESVRVGHKHHRADQKYQQVNQAGQNLAAHKHVDVMNILGYIGDYEYFADKRLYIVLHNLVMVESEPRNEQSCKQKTADQYHKIAHCRNQTEKFQQEILYNKVILEKTLL